MLEPEDKNADPIARLRALRGGNCPSLFQMKALPVPIAMAVA